MQDRKNQKGTALMLALFSIMVISFLATDMAYEARIEYRLAVNEIEKIKAKYAAYSGVEISLLRINLYKKIQRQFGGQSEIDPRIIDLIWSFPFVWPPVVGEDASLVAMSEAKDILKDSFQDSSWVASIQSEGSKIDLNQLGSPSEALATATKNQIIQLIENRKNRDDDWALENRDLQSEELVNHMIDWQDFDQESLNGGDEAAFYRDFDFEGMSYPPNRPFRDVSELHFIPEMRDEIYNVIAPQVTVFGIQGINVNYAPKEVLQSIDPQITDEVVTEIINQINDPQGGPFRDEESFINFISRFGVRPDEFNQSGIPLVFDRQYNFRIESIGTFGLMSKKVVAIVFDTVAAEQRLSEILNKEQEENNPAANQANANPQPNEGDDANNPEGAAENQNSGTQQPQENLNIRPNVVFWEET